MPGEASCEESSCCRSSRSSEGCEVLDIGRCILGLTGMYTQRSSCDRLVVVGTSKPTITNNDTTICYCPYFAVTYTYDRQKGKRNAKNDMSISETTITYNEHVISTRTLFCIEI